MLAFPSAGSSLFYLLERLNAAGDGVSDALVAIDFPHHEAHEGNAYKADATNGAITNGEYWAIGFTTPAADQGRIHLLAGFVSEAASHLQLLEGPTNTPASGAALTAYNRDRGSGKTTKLTNLRSYDNAGVVGGTVIHDLSTWSDKRQTTVDRDDEEFILAPETAYAVKLIADANGGGQILLDWYEHVSKEA